MGFLTPRSLRVLPILLLGLVCVAPGLPGGATAGGGSLGPRRVVFSDGRHVDVIDLRTEEGFTYLTLEGGHVIGMAEERIVRIESVPAAGPASDPGDEALAPGAMTGQAPDAGASRPVAPPMTGTEGPPGARGVARGGEDIESIILEAAGRYGIEADLLAAVIAVESGFKINAVSPKGAQGLMQLMPGTARELAVTDPFDPRQNVFAGARYLKQLLEENGNQYWRALAAYNAGAGRVARYDGIPPYRETIDYIRKVIDIYASAASGISDR